MRIVPLLIIAALGGAECERAPTEDFAARRWSPGVAASGAQPLGRPSNNDASLAAGRCIQPMPSEPPPAPPPGAAPGCPPDPEATGAKLPIVRVSFPEARAPAMDVELVRSDHDTSRGLMYRKTMGENNGMLFDLRVRDDHKFWMHNTCIPLDLIYLDEDGLIVGIVENAPTLDDGSRGVDCPSLFVLEVNAGWSRRHGVRPGQRLTIPIEARSP